MWFVGGSYPFEELLLTSLVLPFQDGAQGVGLAAIVGGGTGADADEGEGAFFANLGGSLALGDFVDELAVAETPAAGIGVGGKGHDAVVTFVVISFCFFVLIRYVLHDTFSRSERRCGRSRLQIIAY